LILNNFLHRYRRFLNLRRFSLKINSRLYNLNHESLIHGQTFEELAKQFKVGFLLLAYLKTELSLEELAELMNLEYVEAKERLTHLGIPLMRQKSPEPAMKIR